MKLFSSITLIFFISLLSITIFSQTPKQTPTVEDNDVVKITTNLIQIDATVLDRTGKTVTGLTADDFEIYENDKKQQITNFSFVDLEPNKSSEPTTEKKNKNSIPIPPFSTNLRPEQVRRTLALVVDDLSMSFASVHTVRSALRKFVDEQMQPNDLVAIIRTGGGGGFLQQFTSDKRILYKAIEKVRWNAQGGRVNSFIQSDPSDTNGAIIGTSDGDVAIANKNTISDYNEDIFAIGTLAAINHVIKGMGGLPGRKAVMLFSEGFKLYSQDREDKANNIKRPNLRLINDFQNLTESANRASVVIYTMDTRGLVVNMPGANDNVIPAGGGDKFSINQGEDSDTVTTDRIHSLYETQQGLRSLANLTGGFAVINNNNLSKGIERVLNDQNGYYLLGYEPDEETFDPKTRRFNKLTVKLKRPGFTIRYRSGFFGIKDGDRKQQTKTPQQPIVAALTSLLNSNDIDLQLTSLFANDAQTGNFMRSLLYVNGKNLKFTREADGWEKATFDIVAMIFGENGTVIDEVSRTETIKARAETLQEIREKGFVSTITFPIKKPGAYQMRVVMRDTATSSIGTASQFIEVPTLKKNHLTLSGVLLQRVQTQSNTNIKAQFQPDEQRDVATRSFHAGMNLRFGYAVYNAKLNKTTKSPNLTMQFRIFQDGKQTFVSKEKSIKLVEQMDSQRLFAEGIFTLGKNIKPGDYVLQVIVRDLETNERNRIATQWIDFEVVE